MTRSLSDSGVRAFRRALASIEAATTRPEVRLEEGPAPTRIAPHALALGAEVRRRADDEDVLAFGRFVLLHDPSCPEPWDGAWRVVTYLRSDLVTGMADNKEIGRVSWGWLEDTLAVHGLEMAAAAGTVTRVVSQGFASLAEEGETVQLEMRASWSPTTEDYGAHLKAWTDLVCSVAGLPPLPEGVVALPGQRR